MANQTPTETLGQIVMDMHKLATRPYYPTSDARLDINAVAAAVRTLAEAVLSLHASLNARTAQSSLPDQYMNAMRREPPNAAQSPADVQRQHLDTFGGGR